MSDTGRTPTQSRLWLRRRAADLAGWTKQATRLERVALAMKAAIAGSVAWLLAPYVPLADSEYSYYAPLGVLVSMYPTLAGSARAGAQAMFGLAAGIALGLGGLATVSLGAPGIVAVAVVIALGILIGGIGALGAGSDWVAIAALFVLLLGGGAAETYSLSYLLTMAFGVLIGILTNLIAPPLYMRRASDRLSVLRDAVSSALRAVADGTAADVVVADDVEAATRDLEPTLESVAREVAEAEESSRANPRSIRRRQEQKLNARRMAALSRTTRLARELADVLAHAAEEESELDLGIREPLARAVRASADLVAAPVGDEDAANRLTEASEALDAAIRALDDSRLPAGAGFGRAHAYAAAVCVRRIIDASREFVSVD